MPDYVPDTPVVLLTLCPICEIERDPAGFVARFCAIHTEEPRGTDDRRVAGSGDYIPTAEAGGADNAAFCDLLHRKKTLLR